MKIKKSFIFSVVVVLTIMYIVVSNGVNADDTDYTVPLINSDISPLPITDEDALENSIYNSFALTMSYLHNRHYDAADIKKEFSKGEGSIFGKVTRTHLNYRYISSLEALEDALNDDTNDTVVIGVMKAGFLDNKTKHAYVFMRANTYDSNCKEAYVYDASSTAVKQRLHIKSYSSISKNAVGLHEFY